MHAEAEANDIADRDAAANNSDMYKYCCSLLSLSCLTSLTSLLFFAIIYACFTTFFYAYILYTLVHLSSLCPSISVALIVSFILLIAIYISSILALRYRYNAKHKRSAVTLEHESIINNNDETRLIADAANAESYSSMTDTTPAALSSPLLSRSQLGSAMIVHRRRTDQYCACSLGCIFATIYLLISITMFVFLLLVFIAVIYFQINSTPHYTGTMYVNGVTGTVTITRDSSAIIHINARTHGDLHFGQGVAMAQSRMWQMEFQRRVGSGRLSELVGENPTVIAIDRLSRTFGFYRAAEASIASLPDNVISNITAFISGINTYLSSSPPLALELLVLGANTPEPWTIADVLVWSKMMSFTLSGNYDREILRWDLLTNRHLSTERIDEILPPFDVSRFPTVIPTNINATTTKQQRKSKRVDWDEPIVDWLNTHQQQHTHSDTSQRPVHSTMALYQRIYRRMFGSTQASNNWVVSGAMTTTRRPFLCNDPHLQLMAPSIWLLMHLQISDAPTVQPPNFFTLDVIGACLPGIPGVVIGRNQFIAWGVTNTGADVQDIFVHSGNATHYEYNHKMIPYTTREETINVNGGDPITFTVRSSIYGPIISDLPSLPDTDISSSSITNLNQTMAIQWTSLLPNDTTILAFLQVNYARDWRGFVRALESYVAPSQNFVYADRMGHIGYVMSGKIPLRAADHSGLYPVPGNGSYGWRGYVPFSSMPMIEATTEGYIISANNRVTNTSFPLTISYDWDGLEGYRAKRIDEMIRGTTNHSASTMKTIQNDQTSLLYNDLKWTLQHIQPYTISGRAHLAILHDWNGIINIGSTSATLFEAWYMELSRITNNETGHSFWNVPQYITQTFNYQIRNLSYNINITSTSNNNSNNNNNNNNNSTNIDNNDDIACRYYHSIYHLNSTQSGCLQYASDSFDRITSINNKKSDADISIPQWGISIHQATFMNQLLGNTLLSCLANRITNHGGDWFTINVGDYRIPDTTWFPFNNHNDNNNNDDDDNNDDSLLSVVAGPSYRQIIDLSSSDGINDDSFYINSLGQSGNEMDDGVNSYDNMLSQWTDGEYINIKAMISQADKAFQFTLQTS